MTDLAVKRWWWAPAAVGTATVAGGVVLAVEAVIGFGIKSGDALYLPLLLAHVLAGVVVAAVVTAPGLWRREARYVRGLLRSAVAMRSDLAEVI